MAHRIAVFKRPGITDAVGLKTVRRVARDLDLTVERVETVEVYVVDGDLDDETLDRVAGQVFTDPVLEEAVVDRLAPGEFDWLVEVGFRPGVTDNVGRTARESLALVLDRPLADTPRVYNAREYRFIGALERDQVERIASSLLANTLIERVTVSDRAASLESGPVATVPRVKEQEVDTTVQTVDLSGSDEDLARLSREMVLALSVKELCVIRDHYASPEVVAQRAEAGLPPAPTDVEMECLAQTWSEHCKHKIFNAHIYNHRSDDEAEVIDSLFDTFIKGATDVVREKHGDDDICVSVFKDNAGVVRFTDEHNLVFKVETHNSPSALDPYGGALTGIVGVNRDPFGTGMGADLIFNTNVFCLASPFYEGEIPPRLLHPRRVLEGVREGVEHGGNKSGIPTVNGSLVFDDRYLGKPLVYCGTGGIMPATIRSAPSHEKAARPQNVIVMVGGRIGADGIHGATFSSEELHEGSPATAVQIGDPITQKRMTDLLLVARDQGLYTAITDNGAGGLSSSVGEMAEDSGGADVDLSKAPLKYAGLAPWEIFLSEAQERMTIAVEPQHVDAFMALAERYQVEASSLGTFNDSGQLTVRWGDQLLARLDMTFLHEGLPPMRLEARLAPGPAADDAFPPDEDWGETLLSLLGRLNVCSKEYWVRQYDHEVQGGSVVKPLCGALGDGPSDAAVLRPLLDRPEGVVVAHGICPRFIDVDPYHMAACAVDEAVRNAVCVGADPTRLAALDNFCWSDPVVSESNPQGAHKLGQLVETCRALYDACVYYGIPLISGKDSMKNDYRIGDTRIGIPPTLLISVLGQMKDASMAVTMDAKAPGHLVYVVGTTGHHLAATEWAGHHGWTGASVPQVDLKENEERYRRLHEAISRGLVASCHDLSDGGLAVALAESAFAGDLGMDVDLGLVPREELGRGEVILFAETPGRFLVTLSPRFTEDWEQLMADQEMALVGTVTEEKRLKVSGLTRGVVIDLDLETLRDAWKRPLDL
jgi:phosphoribosylformylglycinamidine synthase subunit PurSL